MQGEQVVPHFATNCGINSTGRRRCGGIGRHVRLKIVWGNPSRFDSGQRHHAPRSAGWSQDLVGSTPTLPTRVSWRQRRVEGRNATARAVPRGENSSFRPEGDSHLAHQVVFRRE